MSGKIELVLSPEQAASDEYILTRIKQVSGLENPVFKKLRQSVDARKKPVRILLQLEYFEPDEDLKEDEWKMNSGLRKDSKEVVIVGFGPAGMFAALKLLEKGYKPLVLERGKKVKERRRDLAILNREGKVDPESNYCFGEGGAGTYSDGKLYTRSKKRGDIHEILKILVAHGADPRILYEAHPHIGTNKLPTIVETIRETILKHGGQILFNEKVTGINIERNCVRNVTTSSGKTIDCRRLILATGHSARDVFEFLNNSGVRIEAKSFALGVRIEHPQDLIDSIQYKCEKRSELLPAASYSLVEQVMGRGVFSFCMCPGGIIAPAATSPGEIVVNGWSPSKRNGKFANSGMVVGINEKDWQAHKDKGELAAMYFQQSIEKMAYLSVLDGLRAPAQNLLNFITGKNTYALPDCSYIPGVKEVALKDILPPFVTAALQQGLLRMGKKMKGYLTGDAILVGVESRTSSPVKIPRDKETLQHVEIKGLYPCGEGAGYAGGIMSAALDGIACACKISEEYS
ncbi:MAG: FAD-dependent oxidoreductase [Flavobacteriales bacterium]|nr:FAD-dependent oxidoreductase [Flavobacteriales bacterium]